MKRHFVFAACLVLLSLWLVSQVTAQQDQPTEQRIDFSRDIRPILSDTCFKCHGPDNHTREGGLRLDTAAGVFQESEVVVPHDLSASELFQRMITDDADLKMPPPDSGRSLDEQQIELFRRWIEQGAEWGQHWSFEAPQAPEPPVVSDDQWCRNQIDRFVLRRLGENQLQPASEADRHTLARRLALDLTGLPPNPAWLADFLSDSADSQESAYETYVDRLLNSPQYGEHMARYWLDVARYGDTHGLHLDNYREHWPYRDWIINAFNSNLPYDQFSTQQLAGDLLDNPTDQQLVATGFNRAHVTTAEGGAIKAEVRVRNVVDRTATFGTVFLGLTVGCAQCHDHKFDPISQEEFYSLYAYFNSLDADPMDGNVKNHQPSMMVANESEKAELEKREQALRQVNQKIQQLVDQWKYSEPDDPPATIPDPKMELWIDDTLPETGNRTGEWATSGENPKPHSGELSFKHTAVGLKQYVLQGVASPWQINDKDELFTWVYLDRDDPPRQIMLQWNDGNWEHRAYWGEDLTPWGAANTPSRYFAGRLPRPGQWVELKVPAAKVGLQPGALVNGLAVTQFDGTVYWDQIGRVNYPSPFPANRSLRDWTDNMVQLKGKGLPNPVKKIFETVPGDWTEAQAKTVRNHFIEYFYHDARSQFAELHKQRALATKQRDEFRNNLPTTLIYRETKEPRATHVLTRGQYDQPAEVVPRAIPKALPELPDSDTAKNDRLALANWLFTEQHPLTARVAVNRFWQQLFGEGLVETSEDFGAQGTFPTHPDLLDHLAVSFREDGWDVKRLMKTMVMSATYRQSSVATPDLLVKDPRNLLHARGRRYRLDAEVLRDQALCVSGLLVDKIGGPSVKPPQPDGLWFTVGYSGSNTVRFAKDTGHEKVHRRSMYTFWKRTAPAPQMNILDAPSREVCTVRRERTNTPLQALMLMNDPQYVEAARYMAQRVIDEGGESNRQKASWLLQLCLTRPARDVELKILESNLEKFHDEFQANQEAAKLLIQIGETPADQKYDAIDLAAWTMVANLVMNMDEFLTRN